MQNLQHLATSSAMTVWGIAGNFLALIVLSTLLFFFALKAGRAAFISLALSFYAGLALYLTFPYTAELVKAAGGTPLTHTVVSIVLFAACTFFPYILIRRVSTSGMMHIHPIPLFLLALITGGFLLAVGYHYFAISRAIPLTPSLDQLFAPAKYFFWWFIAPLVALFMLAR